MRTLLAVGVAALTSAPLLAQCPGTDDAFEDNDTCATALPLGTGVYPGLYCERKNLDPDLYRITLPPNYRVDVTVTLDPSLTDIDIDLFDSGCTTLLKYASTDQAVEKLHWTNGTGAPIDVVVNVHVWGFALVTCGDYDLELVVAPDPCLTGADDVWEDNDSCATAVAGVIGAHEDLFVSKWDPDFYSYTIPAGETIDIAAFFKHAHADVDMVLYDAGACGGGLGTGLAESASGSSDEALTYTNTSAAPLDVVLDLHVWPDSNGNCAPYDFEVYVYGPPGWIGTNTCGPANLNSSGNAATIAAYGNETAGANDVRLDAAGMAQNQFGFFLNSMAQGFVMPPGSQGNLCLGGAIGRHSDDIGNTGAAGEFSLQLDLDELPTAAGKVAVQPGETWYWQAWFRDANPSPTSNFTDGICITFE